MSRTTTLLQALALLVLLSFLPISFFLPNGTALVWTVLIPILPLFIVVVGYNRWRKICPLAWVAALGQFLQWVPKRNVSGWFEKNYYTFQFTLLFLALSTRLLLLNFEGTFLALFFLALVVIAFVTNIVYAGKSWCNFFCSVNRPLPAAAVLPVKTIARTSILKKGTGKRTATPLNAWSFTLLEVWSLAFTLTIMLSAVHGTTT